MQSEITLGYWKTRGIAQVSRLLLAYTNTQWQDKFYQNPKQWLQGDKQKLDFPQVPYLIDQNFKFSDQSAINHYIIKRSGNAELLGKGLQDEALVQCLISVVRYVKTKLAKLFFDEDHENKLKDTIDKITPKLDQLSTFYGDKQFSLTYLTLADFYVSQFSHYVQKISQELYNKYPFLKTTRNAIQNLPSIQNYYNQDSAISTPFLTSFAKIKF